MESTQAVGKKQLTRLAQLHFKVVAKFMNNTSINDPESVKALLDQLSTSQAWQQVSHSAPASAEQSTPSEQSSSSTSSTASQSSISVSALLSQLQTSAFASEAIRTTSVSPDVYALPQSSSKPYPRDDVYVIHDESPSTSDTSRGMPDLKSCTFQQALPVVAQLADDPSFIDSVTRLKREQDNLERRLWEERLNIRRKYEEKIKVAKTKASMIGTGISKHEADMIWETFKKELDKFDRDRVLPAWDGLVAQQQTTLAELQVPTMFTTQDGAIRQRQQNVMQVVESLVIGGKNTS